MRRQRIRPKARKDLTNSQQKDGKSKVDAAQAKVDNLSGSVGALWRQAKRDLQVAQDVYDACKKLDVKRCIGSLETAATKLTKASDVLQGIENGADFAKLLAAEAELASVKVENQAFSTTMDAWNELDTIGDDLVNDAASSLTFITIDNASLDSKLSTGAATLAISASMGTQRIDQSWSVNLGKPSTISGDDFANKVATTYKNQNHSIDSTPKTPSILSLAVDPKDKTRLTSMVSYRKIAQQVDGAVEPKGIVTLYKKAADGTWQPVAHARFNDHQDDCSNPNNTVFFNPKNSGNCGAWPEGHSTKSKFVLVLDKGLDFFYAGLEKDSFYSASASPVVVINNP